MSRRAFDPLWLVLGSITGTYLLFWLGLLGAAAVHSSPSDLWHALQAREVRYAIGLSLVTCTLTALLSLLLAVPVGYLIFQELPNLWTLLGSLIIIGATYGLTRLEMTNQDAK